jgi:ABC-type uncharacterized transport system permease subunit
MALAVILISRGNPNITIVLAVMFGLFDALSLQLQSNFIPSQFLFMLPYLMAIGTLIFINLFKSKKLLQER